MDLDTLDLLCLSLLPSPYVVEHKSLCLMHTEGKQTEMSEFGAEKGLLKGQARRTGGSRSEDPNFLMGFWGKFL